MIQWTTLLKPKVFGSLLGAGVLVFGLWQLYSFVHDRGYVKRDRELASVITQLSEERNTAVDNYNRYKREYDDWVKNTRDAQARQLADQQVLNEQLEQRNRELLARTPEVTIEEVIRYVPAEVDARYPLPVGFLRLYSQTLQGRSGAPTTYGLLPDSTSTSFGEASSVTLSQFGLIASYNNTECRVRGALIDDWQDWYDHQKAAFEELQRAYQQTPNP